MEQLQVNVGKVPEHFRPALRRAVGDVTIGLLAANKVVTTRLTGACQGRPMSGRSLKEGMEGVDRFASSDIPTIRAVEAVLSKEFFIYEFS